MDMINKIIACDSAETRAAVRELIQSYGHSVLLVSSDFYGLQITSLNNNAKLSDTIHNAIVIKFGGRVSVVKEIGFE